MLTKPRSAPRASNTSMYAPNLRRRVSPLMIIGISVPVLLVLIGAGVVVALPKLFSHAAAALNPNCTLIVPARALSAQGLATPYQLFAPDAAANGPCNEGNINQSAFVQATIYDPAAHVFSIYSPLVIDKGATPAVAPVVPKLPPNAVVVLEFGFNGTLMTLQGANGRTLANAKCVNGLNGSVFGQYADCNGVNFFRKVNADIAAGALVVPPIGVGTDGQPCPTTRDFKIVDMDQSDNVQTQYLLNAATGQTAQLSAANMALLPNATPLGNPSDNALVTKFVDPALGCKPWTAPDLADAGKANLSMALDEIQANAFQGAPIALIPLGDEMTLVNANPSMQKTTLYRQGVDQPAATAANANTTTYCTNLLKVGLPNIQKDMTLFTNAASPAPAMATNLFTFLGMRFNATFGAGGLNCVGLLNVANPVTLTMDGNGVVTAVTITQAAAGTTTTGTGTTTAAQTATGTANITLDPNAGNAALALTASYPNHLNAAITVSIVDTAAAKTIFTQQINTDDTGMASLDSAINGLRGLTAIPATWVYQIGDPNMNNTVVGSAAVVANGVNATATIAAAAAAPATGTTPAAGTTPANGTTPAAGTTPANGTTPATGTTPAATPASVTSPASSAATSQVTPANAPFNKVKKHKHHVW